MCQKLTIEPNIDIFPPAISVRIPELIAQQPALAGDRLPFSQ